MENKAINVLFVLGSMEIGGVQSGIMNFAKVTPPEQVHFDVLVQSRSEGFHEREFQKYGHVYHLPLFHAKNKLLSLLLTLPNDLLWRVKLNAFLNKHRNYDVIHAKLLATAADTMEIAKKHGIPVRVAQSHVDKPERMNAFSIWYYKWCAKRIERSATTKLAVSPGAADLLFDKFGGRVIKNPTISLKRLDPSQYHSQPHSGIDLIQIGTYSHRKNQLFSVNILKALRQKNIESRLIFVGYTYDDSGYEDEVRKTVVNEGFGEYVTFLPKESDIPKLLSESDYMLIPSLREGLPNVALEAQAMGVPCFISDTVNPETDCGLCTFLSLEDGPEKWAEVILQYRETHGTQKRYIDMSAWDNEHVCQEYVKIWSGKCDI